jgi:hypothetical protein
MGRTSRGLASAASRVDLQRWRCLATVSSSRRRQRTMEGLLVDAKYVGNLFLGRRRGVLFRKLHNMVGGFNCEVSIHDWIGI